MKREPHADLYVLDALANDTEDLESILRMLNSDTELGWTKEWGRTFSRQDVVEALSRLISKDLVRVLTPTAEVGTIEHAPPTTLPRETYDNVYFATTARGRLVHANWDPALEAFNSSEPSEEA